MKTISSLLLSVLTLDAQPAFYGRELLGRVTNTSVTINLAPAEPLEFYFEYGAAPKTYPERTTPATATADAPVHTLIDKLQPNTRYYYRLRYRTPGAAAYAEGPERTFHTQRPRGATFRFALQFDPHMDENSDANVYQRTLANQLAAAPDFLIDLGDTFMSDKQQPLNEKAVIDRVRLMRTFYDQIGHSVPLFLSLGNHEGEWGRNLNGTPNNVAVWDTLWRKKYYPNPSAGSFFSGDTRVEPFVGLREAYYAFEWGDALFVILDPYWNRPAPPEQSGDWSLTLGRAQYDWLQQTLEASSASFKFVFAHNLIGGRDLNGPMRGGVETAKYLEWGGYQLDDSWGFDRARPGWPMPIHQLLATHNVTAFFHGHDHLYARQELDGVIYQEGPQPSARNFNLGTRAIDYSYTSGTVLGGTGYLLVEVSPGEVKTQYIQTWLPTQETATRPNGLVADTWVAKRKAVDLRVRSAASYAGGVLAAGSLAAAFGEALPASPVLVRDSQGVQRQAETLAATATQVNFLIPPATAPGPAQLTVGARTGDFFVAAPSPGLFAINANGRGPAAATAVRVRSDGTHLPRPVVRCAATPGTCTTAPLDLGSPAEQLYLSLYGTGLRNTAGPGQNDIVATIGGERAEILYAGPQPAFAGLDQINLRVPRALAGRGEVPVSLAVGGRVANSVLVNIQ
ncbi:MAG: metallophosphoesterase [Acidobacteriota bacterium]